MCANLYSRIAFLSQHCNPSPKSTYNTLGSRVVSADKTCWQGFLDTGYTKCNISSKLMLSLSISFKENGTTSAVYISYDKTSYWYVFCWNTWYVACFDKPLFAKLIGLHVKRRLQTIYFTYLVRNVALKRPHSFSSVAFPRQNFSIIIQFTTSTLNNLFGHLHNTKLIAFDKVIQFRSKIIFNVNYFLQEL